MSRLALTKLEATGNTFLVGVDLGDEHPVGGASARDLCRQHHTDGVIRVLPGRHDADLTMELTNADGSPAEISGNGVRCLAVIAVRDGLVPGTSFVLATGAGLHRVEYAETPEGASVRVDMGAPRLDPADIPLVVPSPFGLEAVVDGVSYEGDAVGMGNPHYVLFVDDPASTPVETVGAVLEHDSRFPNRTNVEFVRAEGRGAVRMRVWERGVGETASSGTGSSAAAVAAHGRGLVDADVDVLVPGGRVRVEIGETVWTGGPVSVVDDLGVRSGGRG